MPLFYKHAAPLGLNAAQLVARYPSLGEVTSPNGLGNPTPTNSIPILNPAIRSIRRIRDSDRWDMSPLWGFGYLMYAVFYKHAAPLGLNAPVLLSPNGLGNPTPTNSIVR